MANQTKDPVCGMQVDEKQTPYKTDYHNKTYGFCSEQCLKKFTKEPLHYISKK